MVDYAAVLSLDPAYAGSEWTLDGHDYAGLTWLSDTPKPTQAELDAAWPQVQHERAVAQVRAARHAAYTAPDGPDTLFLRWQRGDATEQDWLASVEAVKQAHPYPEQ